MEFSEESNRVDRKIWSRNGWKIEYSVHFTSTSDDPDGDKPKNLSSLNTVFAFHGFARPLEDFIPLVALWPKDYAFISVHLPHHGKSGPDLRLLPLDAAIEPKELLHILAEIAKNEGLKSDSFDLIGYSIGGRIALSLIEFAPKKCNRVLLLAPDGLKQSPFYGITVHTRLGKVLWFAIDRHSEAVLKWSDRLLRFKLISPHLQSFIAFHLSSHAMRLMVWNGWRTHRLCWPSHKQIATAFKSAKGPIDLCFGNRDRIIPIKNGLLLKKLTRSLPHINFHNVPTGHGMLRKEALSIIIQRIFPK
jgi:pimeloyl-ACP methyl ester carboxylesterase